MRHLPKKYSFFQGHEHLDNSEIQKLKELLAVTDDSVTGQYEETFARLIGSGSAVSYATARMAFYEIMATIGVSSGDEVIILGFTCAVMANAVIRRGGKLVYSDVDLRTFGSCPKSIQQKISPNTKVVVAQHSFGIPCNIQEIKEVCRRAGVFLIEDCSLTLGSQVDNTTIGNFGDASIFSTDHSKPLNTLLGGLVYSTNATLISRLKARQNVTPQLPQEKQKAIWRQFLFEQKYCYPEKTITRNTLGFIERLKRRALVSLDPFLSEDFSSTAHEAYPYPARLPTFLAALGLIELSRWPIVEAKRIDALQLSLKWAEEINISVPDVYFDEELYIVPLRFVWLEEFDTTVLKRKFQKFIDVSWIWFTEPVMGATDPVGCYFYDSSMCPVSEMLFPRIMNLPCNLGSSRYKILLEQAKHCF